MRQVQGEGVHSEGKHPRHSASAAFGGMAILVAGIAGGCVSSRPPAVVEYESIESLAVRLLEGRSGSAVRLEAIRRLVDNCFGMGPKWGAEMPTGLLCHVARFGSPCEVRELAVRLMELENCSDPVASLILKYALGNPSLDQGTKQRAMEFLAAGR